MILDLHVHTRAGSGDSSIDYEDIVPWAKSAGLDGVCITEHSYRKTGVAKKLSRKYDFLILEGFELSTELGDVLIYGVDEVPLSLYRFEDIRRHVVDKGGVMFAAHPFRSEITRPVLRGESPTLSLEEAVSRRIFTMVDGIEVVNGWSCSEEFDFSRRVTEMLALRASGSSDAHSPDQIGSCATVFESRITNEAELVSELKLGCVRPRDRRPLQSPAR